MRSSPLYIVFLHFGVFGWTEECPFECTSRFPSNLFVEHLFGCKSMSHYRVLLATHNMKVTIPVVKIAPNLEDCSIPFAPILWLGIMFFLLDTIFHHPLDAFDLSTPFTLHPMANRTCLQLHPTTAPLLCQTSACTHPEPICKSRFKMLGASRWELWVE
jgi:hypothetical protein